MPADDSPSFAGFQTRLASCRRLYCRTTHLEQNPACQEAPAWRVAAEEQQSEAGRSLRAFDRESSLYWAKCAASIAKTHQARLESHNGPYTVVRRACLSVPDNTGSCTVLPYSVDKYRAGQLRTLDSLTQYFAVAHPVKNKFREAKLPEGTRTAKAPIFGRVLACFAYSEEPLGEPEVASSARIDVLQKVQQAARPFVANAHLSAGSSELWSCSVLLSLTWRL